MFKKVYKNKKNLIIKESSQNFYVNMSYTILTISNRDLTLANKVETPK